MRGDSRMGKGEQRGSVGETSALFSEPNIYQTAAEYTTPRRANEYMSF